MSNLQVFGPAKTLVTVSERFTTPGNPLGIITNGCLVVENGKILWVGPESELPGTYSSIAKIPVLGNMLLPGLIDSHTHSVYAGNRADEFEARLAGKTYQQIAESGGGILKTVRLTREASFEELKQLTQQRLNNMLQFGVTTVECKSGYGLTFDDELKSLEVLKTLQSELKINIISTLMAAHDFPPEYKNNHDAYVDLICEKIIPEVAHKKLAVFNDVFCEDGYFTLAQSKRILETGLKHGLIPKIHAEEFSNQHGTALACEMNAASADHLLAIEDDGIAALQNAAKKITEKTVATLLPATAFFLNAPYAPVRKLLDAGITVALATDFNPGSSNCPNMLMVMALGCLQMKMRVDEVIQAVTINAAKALRLEADRGSLDIGKRADFVISSATSPAEMLYHWSENSITSVWVAGERVYKI